MPFMLSPAGTAANAQARSDEAIARARSVESELEATQHQVDRLYLIVEGMWTIMRDRMAVSDEDLGRLVESIDLRDGVLDGKNKKVATLCVKCQRPTSIRTGVCLYCGHKNPQPPF